MCNQIVIVGVVQGLLELLNFVEKVGFFIFEVVEVISQGVVGSWQMQVCYQIMVENCFDFGFVVDWMCKDLGICLQIVDENGVSLLVMVFVDQFYKEVQQMGGGCWDILVLIVWFWC